MASRNHGLSRKAKSVCVEVDAEVVGGQRADEQRREEGADAGGGGHPHPLQDVEEELHGPIA